MCNQPRYKLNFRLASIAAIHFIAGSVGFLFADPRSWSVMLYSRPSIICAAVHLVLYGSVHRDERLPTDILLVVTGIGGQLILTSSV